MHTDTPYSSHVQGHATPLTTTRFAMKWIITTHSSRRRRRAASLHSSWKLLLTVTLKSILRMFTHNQLSINNKKKQETSGIDNLQSYWLKNQIRVFLHWKNVLKLRQHCCCCCCTTYLLIHGWTDYARGFFVSVQQHTQKKITRHR